MIRIEETGASTENQKSEEGSIRRDGVDLPRLLYVGDVCVDSTVGGSALLYRLFQTYPNDQLFIAEGSLWRAPSPLAPRPEKRLANVKHQTFFVGLGRLLQTRLGKYYSNLLHITAHRRAKRLGAIVESFKPDAILTVPQFYSWLTADAVARAYQLPLHLIVHDDFFSIEHSDGAPYMKRFINSQFRRVYREATSRLCVSPNMVDILSARYGVTGTVLYPSRPAHGIEFQSPPIRVLKNKGELVFAYAGTIHSNLNSLVLLSGLLERTGGKLIIYSNISDESAKRYGLLKASTSLRGMLPVSDLMLRLREEADVVFVPMSFEQEDIQNMRVCFPTKLADCSAVGLPLLIWGPPYSSAVRWARENPGVAEVVDEFDPNLLEEAIFKLRNDNHYRQRLAETALIKGREFFSHDNATAKFFSALRG